MEKITGEELGGLLFNIHKHIGKDGKIIYYEEDLLPILKAIGLPKPKWGDHLTITEFKKKRKKK